MRRVLTLVHRWVGLGLALVLGVVGLTGVLLLARAPYYRWQHPSFAAPITAADQARQGPVLERIDATFGGAATTIRFPQPGMHVFQVWLADDSEAFVDARTGDVLDHWRWHERLPAFVFELHAHLMGGHTGLIVNGVVAVLGAVFLAVGGVLLWWPRRGALRVRAVWPRTLTPAALLRSHAATGVITIVPLTLFLVTGAGLALSSYALPWLSRMFDQAPPERPRLQGPATRHPRVRWDSALAATRGAFPDGRLVFLSPGTPANAVLSFRLRLPGEWHPNGRSMVLVDPISARVLQTIDARRQGLGTRLGHLLYPLHAARIGDAWSPTLTVLAGLAGVGLGVLSASGVLTWWTRQRPAARGRPTTRQPGARPRRDRTAPCR